MVLPPQIPLVGNQKERGTFLIRHRPGNEPARCALSARVPRMKIVSTRGLSRSPAGAFLYFRVFACPMLRTPRAGSSRMRWGGTFRTGSAAWTAERLACIRRVPSGKRPLPIPTTTTSGSMKPSNGSSAQWRRAVVPSPRSSRQTLTRPPGLQPNDRRSGNGTLPGVGQSRIACVPLRMNVQTNGQVVM